MKSSRMQCNPSIYISRGKQHRRRHNCDVVFFSFYRSFFLSSKPKNDTGPVLYFEIQTATKNKKEIYIYIYTQQIHLVDMYID